MIISASIDALRTPFDLCFHLLEFGNGRNHLATNRFKRRDLMAIGHAEDKVLNAYLRQAAARVYQIGCGHAAVTQVN